MIDTNEAVKRLIESIKGNDIYNEYIVEREKVKQHPDLMSQIDDYRNRTFELQNSENAGFDSIEKYEQDYEQFRENPLVSDFLAAELAFCRMMQEINTMITEGIDFESPYDLG